MPLFDWLGAFRIGMTLGNIILGEVDPFEDGSGTADAQLSRDQEALARLVAYRAERQETEEAKLERTRWLEEHRAERSFSCGIVPDRVLAATQPKPVERKPPSLRLPSEPGWAAPAGVREPPMVQRGEAGRGPVRVPLGVAGLAGRPPDARGQAGLSRVGPVRPCSVSRSVDLQETTDTEAERRRPELAVQADSIAGASRREISLRASRSSC